MLELLAALGSHLGELKKRLAACVILFFLSLFFGMVCAGPVIRYLLAEGPANSMLLHAFSPWDSIQAYMQIAVLVACALTGPFLALQIWFFVRPGLTRSERLTTLRYIPMAAILFLAGIAFGYFVVFQIAFSFTEGVSSELDVSILYGIGNYFSFMMNIVFPIALLFELPVAVMFLTRLSVLTPERMKRIRRYAYMLLVIVGVTVTPPDFISDFLLILPLLSLYEFSTLCSRIVYRNMRKKQSALMVRSAP